MNRGKRKQGVLMRTFICRWGPGVGSLVLLLALAAPAPGVILLFRDGFTVRGRITQATEVLVDPVSGHAFPIPKGGEPYKIDDNVRHIIFSPSYVIDVLREPFEADARMQLKRYGVPLRNSFLPGGWSPEDAGAWDKSWRRPITLQTPRGPLRVTQRLTLLAPQAARADALEYNWYCWYKPAEFGPEVVRDLVRSYYAQRKEESEHSRREQTARFLLLAGWPEWAKKELPAEDPPAGTAPGLRRDIEVALAQAAATAVRQAMQAHQYQRARQLLERFFQEQKEQYLEEKDRQKLQDLMSQLRAQEQRLREARRLLTAVQTHLSGAQGEPLRQAAQTIAAELHPDTLPRLETFLSQAAAWEAAVQQGRPPARTAEQVLACALSGWLQGNPAASEQVDAALALWQARDRLLKYLRATEPAVRRQLLATEFSQALPVDVIARLLPYLPPVEAYPTPRSGVPLELFGRSPDGVKNVRYLLQLPAEYHPMYPYPLLIVLHRGQEKPEEMLARWAPLADRYGFLLAAPAWGERLGYGNYRYTAQEHATVLDCLWDVQRRFQVDADRIFLFGAEEGGLMACDVGLSHPSLFAGVAVMSAYPAYFAARYGDNARYLPFYLINGDQDSLSRKANEAFAKHAVQQHYPLLLAEYRGRSREWFAAELPLLAEWMSRKKRHFPQQELGRPDRNDCFVTLRSTDNHFYWLSTTAITPAHLNDAAAWDPQIRPACLQARISGGNYIHLWLSGLKQVTVWLGPGMINFDQEVHVQVNGVPARRLRVQPRLEVLLEDVYLRGDRQHPFVARIDLNL
jgi:predicted esterase